jgi:basic membrane protein A
MAAKLSKSGKIGVVGSVEIAEPKLYVDGFKKGVADTNPGAVVLVTWTGSYSDVALAAEAAQTQITNEADVLTGVSQGVVGAIAKAKENDVVWFGTQSNQTSLAPEIVAACQVYHWEVALTQIIDQIKKGAQGGRSFQVDLENKGEVIEYNEGYQLPEEVKAAAQTAIDGIVNGSIKPLP